MFSYYGSKSKIVHLYPKPKHNLIIEPFAGSARYALKYFDRDVLLIDKYEKIVAIWNYLKQASTNDILSLPTLKDGETVDDYRQISNAEKWLIGFCVNRGSSTPKKSNSRFNSWEADKINISKQLFKIRHWQIKQGEYTDAPDLEATWFIDPPYVVGGHEYKFSNKEIDFKALELWCKSRSGQTIVCESSGAEWLKFHHLSKLHGSIRTTTEVFWTNEAVEVQQELFSNIFAQSAK